MVWVKICGVTRVEDARLVAASGADAIGLNFVPGSPRCLDEDAARRIVEAVGEAVEIVGVIADLDADAARGLATRLGLARLQLHGSETAELVASLAPLAYKAVRMAGPEDATRALSFPGDRLLVDASRAGALGGTGHRFDWSWVVELAAQRPLILAGGLSPDNVADAVAQLAPWGVDVATGVEVAGHPGHKDAARVRAFVERARSG